MGVIAESTSVGLKVLVDVDCKTSMSSQWIEDVSGGGMVMESACHIYNKVDEDSLLSFSLSMPL